MYVIEVWVYHCSHWSANQWLWQTIICIPVFVGNAFRMEEADQPLMTQSMKKALQEMKLAKYSRVILKIHFPEKVVLQAVFRPRETGEMKLCFNPWLWPHLFLSYYYCVVLFGKVYAVEKFLKEVLEDSDIPFYLCEFSWLCMNIILWADYLRGNP